MPVGDGAKRSRGGVDTAARLGVCTPATGGYSGGASLDPQHVRDAVVVGGGPAGLSAATWLARYRRRVLLVDAGEPRNRWVERTHGYLGNDPVAPGELLARARDQLAAYPFAERMEGRVVRARGTLGRFEVELDGGDCIAARRLVLATGVRDAFPKVDRFFDHYGADVFHCSSCDGYEANDRDVVVFGWGQHVVDFALGLLDWARGVTVCTDAHRLRADDADRQRLARYGIDVVEQDAVALVGERGALECVVLADGARLPCQLGFFSIAHEPTNDLARQLGCDLTDERCVAVDGDAQTSVPGVYAAGDVTPGTQLVSVAVAKGATAGIACALALSPERP
jgi:thioredoxin reductase